MGNAVKAASSELYEYPQQTASDARIALYSARHQADLDDKIDQLAGCCQLGGESGCIMKLFNGGKSELDYRNAADYVKRCSERGSNKTFGQELYRRAHKNTFHGENGRLVFNMEYLIPPASGGAVGRANFVSVCKSAWMVVYGISNTEMRNMAVWLKKESNSGEGTLSNNALHLKPFKASTVPNITFAEGERIFEDNLRVPAGG